jgi:hypothetical protein
MTFRRSRIAIVVAMLVLIGWPAPGSAQVQTGSILVRVADEQGGVLPGVNIVISSPSLVGSQMTGATDAGGAHRFPSLPAGDYVVRIDLQGFQTIIRQHRRTW